MSDAMVKRNANRVQLFLLGLIGDPFRPLCRFGKMMNVLDGLAICFGCGWVNLRELSWAGLCEFHPLLDGAPGSRGFVSSSAAGMAWSSTSVDAETIFECGCRASP
ncbi:hypothetical protein Nepgr_032592 [Nepenthes gracilis]|uniref:Uncharacterized protein n=1 Tax=Nepenthes gracilis TaxID=150966 RepID=A0AAD3Y804_NEPGR|nr:hypothetical protein Nepgr_032592 [Nepenthes gracilis]